MSTSSIIQKYFLDLTEEQISQFDQLQSLYSHWNNQINVISRKDIEELGVRHVLHSLGIATIVDFKDGSKILDIGTGGGFPGIPLAILFPNVHFHLVDSIGKKIKVVNEVKTALRLKNVTTEHGRAENVEGQYDFIISRAVTAMPKFLTWIKGKFLKEDRHELTNGILYLKGGDLKEELAGIKKHIQIYNLEDHFDEDYFETKKVVYVKG